jgi:hypothetical protein
MHLDCENVHIRCESTPVSYLLGFYENTSSDDYAEYHAKYDYENAATCLRQKCGNLTSATRLYASHGRRGVSVHASLWVGVLLFAAVALFAVRRSRAVRSREEEASFAAPQANFDELSELRSLVG